MRILLVHNYYGSEAPSGENRVFELERDLLRRHGHEIETFERHSDTLRAYGPIGMVAGAAMTPWNACAARSLAETVNRFRPDVVHAHNTFPIISPAIFAAARGRGRVLTLHNYRLVCPAAIPMRDGRVCTECIDHQSVRPAIRYGCYRGRRLATLPLAANVAFNRWRGTWQHDVERFIALTDFQREMLIQGGLPRNKIAVKPNFFPGKPKVIPFENRPQKIVYVGRLSIEKGVGDLVDAWLAWGTAAPELCIIGDGQERSRLEQRVAGAQRIRIVGQVASSEAEHEIANSRLLLLPSRWFEGFPMVLREAFALGTPVGVSAIGPLPDLVKDADGIVFRAGDPADLMAQVAQRWRDHARLSQMSIASAALFHKRYAETVNYSQLSEIYEQAIDEAKSTQGSR